MLRQLPTPVFRRLLAGEFSDATASDKARKNFFQRALEHAVHLGSGELPGLRDAQVSRMIVRARYWILRKPA